MKKYISIVLGLLIVPSIASAAWWNPTTWFDQSSETTVTASSSEIIALTETINQQNTEISQLQAELSSTTSQAPTVITKTTTQTVKDPTEEADIANLTTQLATAQKNYSMCETNLSTAQNVNSQAQQPVVPSVPATPVTTASISLDTGSPKTQTIVGKYLNVPLLVFDVNPSANNLLPNSLTVNITSSGQNSANSAVSTAYLYQGGGSNPTPIATAIVSNGVASFTPISNTDTSSINKGQTNTFTISVDVPGLVVAAGNTETITASVASFSLIDSTNKIVNTTGNPSGNVITLAN